MEKCSVMPKTEKAIQEMKNVLERAWLLPGAHSDPYTKGLIDSLMTCLEMLGCEPMTWEEAQRRQRSRETLRIVNAKERESYIPTE